MKKSILLKVAGFLSFLALTMLAAGCSGLALDDKSDLITERAVISGTSTVYSTAFNKSSTFTSVQTSGNFTLYATNEKKVTVPSIKSVTVNGKSLDRKIALGGGGKSGQYRCVGFQTGGSASVTVYAAGASGRYLALTDSSGTVLKKHEVSSNITAFSYSVTASGTYYIMSTGSGIDLYCINVASSSSASESSPSSSASASSVTAITLYKSNSKAGTYSSIQNAINAVGSSGSYTIALPKGTYKENYIYYNGSASIVIKGATSSYSDTIIKGHGKDMSREKGRELMEFSGSCNIVLQNLSLVSDYDRKTYGNGQAEVLGFDSTGTLAAYNCAFKSHQDTMRTTGKAWFYNCYVEGDTDFIWMESSGIVALYEKCTIVSVYDSNASSHESYVMAPRRTKGSVIGKGVVLFNSTLKGSSGQTTYLFRNPWGSNSNYYNQGAVVGCTFSGSGWASSCAKSQAMGTGDQQYIGWKLDSSAASKFPNRLSSIGVLSSSVKSSEYSGRRAILNRNVNTSGKFIKDTSKYWDIDKTISNNGWNVDNDNSSAG